MAAQQNRVLIESIDKELCQTVQQHASGDPLLGALPDKGQLRVPNRFKAVAKKVIVCVEVWWSSRNSTHMLTQSMFLQRDKLVQNTRVSNTRVITLITPVLLVWCRRLTSSRQLNRSCGKYSRLCSQRTSTCEMHDCLAGFTHPEVNLLQPHWQPAFCISVTHTGQQHGI